MLELMGRPSSINVRKVLWTCAELGVDFNHTEWGSGGLSLKDPAFLALNPNAMVPVIRDGGLVLWESNTICRYLAAKSARDDLLPSDPARRAIVEQWMDWQATELNSAWRYAFMSLVRKSPAHTERVALEASIAAWNHNMTILDQALAKTGTYVTGPAFTLADVVIGLSVNRWLMTPIARPELPAVSDYFERLTERPGFRAHGRNGLA
ncbi:MAG: glutathione S-transferase [Burkholderiales bacterium]